MTTPTQEQLDRALTCAEQAQQKHGHKGGAIWATEAALSAILQSDQELAELRDQLDAVMRHIPMDYLQRHDVPGATGPTAALNLKAAIKDYAEDRWKLIDRLKGHAELLRHAEAMAGALEIHAGTRSVALRAYRQYQEGRTDA